MPGAPASPPPPGTLYIDSPAYAGGEPKGPVPTEMMMCAYAGATAMLLYRITQGMGITIHELEVDARDIYSPRGIGGIEGYYPCYTEIEVDIKIRTDAASDQIEQFKFDWRLRCTAYGVLAASGAEMKENWDLSA